MSRPDIWMPFYLADYLAETTRLTTEQHGAYLLLLVDLWKNGSLPDDDETLARITRLPADRWKKHRPILERLFYLDGSEWHHERIERERAKAEEQSARAQERARKGAAGRWGNASSNAPSNASSMPEAMLEQCSLSSSLSSKAPSKSSPQSSPSSSGEGGAGGIETANGYAPAFESLWSRRPKWRGKDVKAKAFEAWQKRIREGHSPDAILDGLEGYRQAVGDEARMTTAAFLGPDLHFQQYGGGSDG